MPELPEVHTIITDLKPKILGQYFQKITTTHKPAVLATPKTLSKSKGAKITEISRRGKFINIFLNTETVITIHLRMSGRLIIKPKNTSALPFERTTIELSETSIRFCDSRKFGKTWINSLEDYEKNTGIYKLGIEPLTPDFTAQKLADLLSGKKGTIKKHLLDQTKIAGIGNIYADEACFYSNIKPDTEVQNLSTKQITFLHSSIIKALQQGINNRGTSIANYADAYGKTGRNQELLYAYGRGGLPCIRCNTTMIKCRVASRGTVYCPSCQQ
ncbi:formamidopyrimidine-DNA glycosylase [Candidatus Peregrinibacteria bacterium HGW-Peregrinibacteria-1]|jgi:formamidopyrimidine-DNA glycosylase|nr:MAG: formamidopyrimidine-DNA glycosylase [Candidatus Peregrinibacteria bacterium HGW-Peregrinibacteria-1]